MGSRSLIFRMCNLFCLSSLSVIQAQTPGSVSPPSGHSVRASGAGVPVLGAHTEPE